MHVLYGEKGYSVVTKVMIISEDFSSGDLGKELFHLVT